MIVQELIDKLNKIEDKTKTIKVAADFDHDVDITSVLEINDYFLIDTY